MLEGDSARLRALIGCFERVMRDMQAFQVVPGAGHSGRQMLRSKVTRLCSDSGP